MTKQEFKIIIEEGNEFEFINPSTKKGYYATKSIDKNHFVYITYEYNKEPIHYLKTFDELCNVVYDGTTLIEMIELLTEEDDYHY